MDRDGAECPVCLSADGDESNWTKWPKCGHWIHTTCALQSALHGNVTCAVCRDLIVDDATAEDVENARDELLQEAHARRRSLMLRKGIRWSSNEGCPLRVSQAVRQYRREQEGLRLSRSLRSRHRAAVAKLRTAHIKKWRESMLRQGLAHVRIQVSTSECDFSVHRWQRRVWRAQGNVAHQLVLANVAAGRLSLDNDD